MYYFLRPKALADGHDKGDIVLKRVAEAIRELGRAGGTVDHAHSDRVVARVGGRRGLHGW